MRKLLSGFVSIAVGNMRSKYFLILLVIACILLLANRLQADEPVVEWEKTFGGSGEERAWSVKQTSDGGYIIAGYTNSFGAGDYDVYLIKTDSDGIGQWQKTFGGSSKDKGRSVQQTSDGGYIITGYTDSFGAGGRDVYLIKTYSDGNSQWQNTFGGSGFDEGYSVQKTSDGGYIIAGYTTSFGEESGGVYLVKADSNGNMQWQRTFGGGESYDEGWSVQQTSDGGYIISGFTDGSGFGDVYLIKTDSSGYGQWGKTFGGSDYDLGASVQQTSDGGYIVGGGSSSSFYLVKTDSSGNSEWQKTFFGGVRGADGYSVQQTSDGGYIIAGYSFASDWTQDVYVVKTDLNGTMLWQKTIGGSSYDEGFSVQQTSDGGYIIAGETMSYGAGYVDVYLVKLSSDNVADIIADGNVDFVDYAILASQWLEAPGEPSADIAPLPDGDGIVDGQDLCAFADRWPWRANKAYNPSPADLATDVDTTTDLSWAAGDKATSHDVYFGTTNPPPFQINQIGTTYDTGTMDTNTTYYWRIDEKNVGGTTAGDTWSFTTAIVLPGQAGNPTPANGTTGVLNTSDLSWIAGSLALNHDVYFGTTNPPPFCGNQTVTTYDPGMMDINTTYYWRIDEKNTSGTTTGNLWSFTTLAVPRKATNPSPANGVIGVSGSISLSWTADSLATSHDVYFGTTNPPPFRVNQTGTTYDTGTMDVNTIYYWRIDEKNANGTTTGDIWNFTTWPESNLVNWWRFNEGSGSTAYNSAGSNNGTINGATWTNDPCRGMCLSFDGIDDKVVFANYTVVLANNGTLSLRFKTSADFTSKHGGLAFLISWENNYWSYLAVGGDGTSPYGIYGETANSHNDYFVSVTSAAPVGAWNHIAVSFYNKTAKAYLNSVLIDTRSVTTGPTLTQIGGAYQVFFNGLIDDVRIYNRALTSEEIEQLYESSL